MLKSIKRSIQLISKDEFDIALFKATCGDTVLPPKEKYLTLLIECLKGCNQRVLALDAFTRIYDQILNISFKKWVESLKWGYILHLCIYTNCKIFVEAMCSNGIFSQVKANQTNPLQQDDFVKFLHAQIVQNYFNYLQNRYENLMYFQNAMDDLEQKEESQKQLIIHKIIKTLTLILKLEKELDISLQKFPQLNLLKHVAFLLLRDLVFFYPIARDYIQQRIGTIMTQDISIAKKLYQNYTELLRIGRNVKKFLLLKQLISDAIDKNEFSILNDIDIEIFQVDQQKNQEIELYFSKVEPKELPFNTQKEPELPIRSKPHKYSCTLPMMERKSDQSNRTLSPSKTKQEVSPISFKQKNHEFLEIVQFDDEVMNKVEDEKETILKLSFHGIQPSLLSPTKTIDTFIDQHTIREGQCGNFFNYPEPDEIRVVKKDSLKKIPPRKQQFTLKKSRELQINLNQDNQSLSSISQKTSGTEYSEQKVRGLNSKNKQQQSNEVNKNSEFFLELKSPLGFLSFQDLEQKQEERKKD